MKKFLICISVIILTTLPAIADTMVVQSISKISTKTPDEKIKVKVMRDCTLGDIELKTGYILVGKMLTVTDPKRLKKNATFTFFPMKYIDEKGKSTHIRVLYVGKFTPKFEVNVGGLAKSAALSVGNHIIKGLSTGFYAVQGAVQNERGNVVTSAAYNVYQNSFLSYIEKGDQLDILPSTFFGLKFSDCKNGPK